MAFGIDPQLWDDADFVALTRTAQITYLYLLNGPEARVHCPGLLLIGTSTLAEGLRMSSNDAHESLGVLKERGFVELDGQRRLIRLPHAPESGAKPGNPNVLSGWYRRWCALPNSALKYYHISSTEIWASISDAMGNRWQSTFGAVDIPQPYQEVIDKRVIYDADLHDKAFREPSRSLFSLTPNSVGSLKASAKPSESLSKGMQPGPGPEPGSGSGSGSDQAKPSGPAGTGPLGPDTESWDVALRLWQRQEDLRARIPGMVPRTALAEDLQRVIGCLIANCSSEAQAMHALEVFCADAERDPSKARYFNGHSNWSPKAFRLAMGMPTGAGGGAGGYVPAGGKKFAGGEVL